MKVVLATNNPGKVREISEIMKPHGIEVVSLQDYPGLVEVEEDGDTFKDNAVKKALAACEHTGLIALADDSGLEVDYLDGAPGVHSSRFAGGEKDDAANNQKLLELLGVPEEERTARFRCVVAIVDREGWTYTAEGPVKEYSHRAARGRVRLRSAFSCRNTAKPLPNWSRRSRTKSVTGHGPWTAPWIFSVSWKG